MSKHTDAIDILNTIRRTLTERLADAVVRNKRHLLDGANVEGNPFSQYHGLDEMIVGIGRLDTALAALREAAALNSTLGQHLVRAASDVHPASPAGGDFGRFTELVSVGRLEEAARELAVIFHMPHDRMITATRFYDRAVRADPTIGRLLENLPARLENASSAQSMSVLVRTFGFQAVETRSAVQALRSSAGSDLQSRRRVTPVGV